MTITAGTALLNYGYGAFALADQIYICSQTPATYTEATSNYALGNMNFGVGNVFGSIGGIAGGESITSNPVTSGTVTANGTVVCWAVVDDVNQRLLATGSISPATYAVVSGEVWTLGAFELDFLRAFSTGGIYYYYLFY